MSKVRPSTQLAQDGASTGQALVWDGSKWVPATAGMTDPTTTKGDLIVRGASVIGRLPVGTDGTVLTADSTQTLGVRWGVTGGTGITRVYTALAADITTTSTSFASLSTAWTVSVTPATGQKVLVRATFVYQDTGATGSNTTFFRINRASGAALSPNIATSSATSSGWYPICLEWIDDTVGSGSAITYELQAATAGGTLTIFGSGSVVKKESSLLIAEAF